ncbi:MAG: ATP-binding protein [Myxococcota bacterium]
MDPIEQEVDRTRVSQLFARAPVALATVVVNGLLMGALLRRAFDDRLVGVWVASLLVVTLGRGIQTARYRRAKSPDPRTWENRFTLGALFNGMAWGVGGAVFVSEDFPLTVLVVFVIGGMVAGASSSTAPSRKAFLAYTAPAVLPMIVRLALRGDGVHAVMALMLLLFAGAMSVLARQSGEALADAMRLRLEKSRLLEELERRTRERGRRMRLMLDRAGVVVVVAAKESLEILDLSENAPSLIGVGAEELLGRSLTDLPLELDVEDQWRDVVMSAKARDGEVVLGASTSSFAHLEIVLVVRELDREELVLLLIKDVAEQRGLQTQLAHANLLASLGTLAAGVAHEINNPLTYIIHNLEEAKDQASEVVSPMLETALRGSRHVERVVRDLASVARPSGHRELVDLGAVVDTSVRLLDGEIRHRAQLTIERADVPLVRGDSAQLTQVVINLLINAVHAIPDGKASENAITIRTWESASEVLMSVEDSGSGMDAATSSRVFEPFFTTKEPGVGTGLGLSMSHSIVTSLGGTISLESELGKGTCFTVSLPSVAGTRTPTPPPVAPVAEIGTSLRILLVDDDERVGEAIRRMLQEHDVVWVGSGAEALTELRARFDVVLCDLMMPEMSGPELYARLETEFPVLVERVVFITGGAFSESTRAFLDRVQPRILTKPFGRATLLGALQEVLPEASTS